MSKPLSKILLEKEDDSVDHTSVRELRVFADNDSHLYHSSKVPIEKNLLKKHAKGVYNHEKAIKLWGYHADRAAQAYHKEFGTKDQHWSKMFPKAVRNAAAKEWADDHRDEHH